MANKPLTEEKVREIILQAVDTIVEGQGNIYKKLKGHDQRFELIETKMDTNQNSTNRQFDELKAELSNIVSKKEFNAAKKSFQN